MNSTLPKIYTGLWLAACLGLAVLGGPRLFQPTGGFPLKSLERQGSLDSVLESVLGEKGLPEKIEAALQRLPRGPVAILSSSGHRPLQVAYVLDYLAWPRPVSLSQNPEPLTPETVAFLRTRFSAIIFCDIPVHESLPPGEKIGRFLTVVPLASP